MCNNKNLILIPCCKRKTIIPFENDFAQPLENMPVYRNNLLEIINTDEILSAEPENIDGILNTDATLTRALDMYQGIFYNTTRTELETFVNEGNNCIHILIVSAFYGLVQLQEGLKKYELQMGDELTNINNPVCNRPDMFWVGKELSQVLREYVTDNKIQRIWSLLPDSLNNNCKTPYHRVFKDLWEESRDNNQLDCFHVFCFSKRENGDLVSKGAGTGAYRAKWLKKILSNGQYLCDNIPPPDHYEFDDIDAVYEYKES